MSRFIGKLVHPKTKKEYYFEWSTIVDAPVTSMMNKKDFYKYYRIMYGLEGMEELPSRMERVEQKGCSAVGDDWTYKDFVSYNRAGENGKRIRTITEMIERNLN